MKRWVDKLACHAVKHKGERWKSEKQKKKTKIHPKHGMISQSYFGSLEIVDTNVTLCVCIILESIYNGIYIRLYIEKDRHTHTHSHRNQNGIHIMATRTTQTHNKIKARERIVNENGDEKWWNLNKHAHHRRRRRRRTTAIVAIKVFCVCNACISYTHFVWPSRFHTPKQTYENSKQTQWKISHKHNSVFGKSIQNERKINS